MTDKSETVNQRIVPIEKVRNIGIIAHIDAGKTTTTERILYETGRTYKIGTIDEGTTQMDWMEQERERGITIQSAATTTFWTLKKDGAVPHGAYRINIIDTPGHIDFTAEVERSLRVLDGAIMVFDGRTGVEAQSETVWHQADKYNVPRICSFNKLNLIGGDFFGSLQSVQERLNPNALPIQLPIGNEYDLKGAVDLVAQKAFVYEDKDSKILKEVAVPEEMKEKVAEYRAKLIEKVAEFDEAVMEKYLNDEALTEEEIKRAIRAGTIAGKFFPVLGGDNRTVSVDLLLDAVIDFLPQPLDLPPVEGTHPETGKKEKRLTDPQGPLTALSFKIQTDPHVGRLGYVRLYSGTLKKGQSIWNSTVRRSERAGRLLLMHANQREEIDAAVAGEIVAVVGLNETTTGDTLCSKEAPILLEAITFPDPVISLAIEPKTKADQEKLGQALHRLSEEDPTFKIKADAETGQTIISGMGELHLEILVDRMKREFKVLANTGRPMVAYKETIKESASAEGKYIRQSGGRGQYGHCLLRVEPLGQGEGFKFVNEIRGTAIPSNFIPAIEKGVKEAMERGVLAGYPLVDMQVAVYDGSYHEVDSSDIAFKIAGSMALQAAVKKANLSLLEPIMKLVVTTPEEFMGDVIGDLSSKRAQILGTQKRGQTTLITCLVPLAEVPGYATTLRSMTQGRASFYMEPSHYLEVPAQIAEKIVAQKAGEPVKRRT